MARLATFQWHSPPPTSVDEVLVIEEQLARLVIRRPRRVTSTVGSYVARPLDEDRSLLMAAGPDPVTFEVWPPMTDPGMLALQVVADRVAETCLASPRATVTFSATVTQAADGVLSVALLALAEGSDPVEFELSPSDSVVHLSGPQGEITWLAMPRPATGFVTGSAEGLGGLGVRARMRAGEPAGTTFEVPDVTGSTTIAIEVAGTLSEALPDERMPSPFAVRTPEASIPR
ncbi:MAG: hypothetical protein ABWZ82_09090 [Candidatus Limnocylindrales bacterium]